MITVKLVKTYGHNRESFDISKAEIVSVAPDSKEVRITYSGQQHLITVKEGGNLYINVYGILPKRMGTNHPDGMTKNVTDAMYHISTVHELIDNEPVLKEYILYRLFPAEFAGDVAASKMK
jgi:hypothetical protein